MKLTDALEDLDDIQEVFTNADLDESYLRHDNKSKKKRT